MSLLTWLGLVSLGKHHEPERQHRGLRYSYNLIRLEADELRRQLDRSESAIAAEISSRVEVTKMLRQAMAGVTSAVGLAQILHAAKLKLEIAGRSKNDDIEAAQPADGGRELKGSSDENSALSEPSSHTPVRLHASSCVASQ